MWLYSIQLLTPLSSSIIIYCSIINILSVLILACVFCHMSFVQKDGSRLQRHCQQLQVPVSSRNYRYGLFGSPLPRSLSAFETDDISNVVKVEKRAKGKSIGCIGSSVDNAANFGIKDQSQVLSLSRPNAKRVVDTTSWNGSRKQPQRRNSARLAKVCTPESYSLPSTHIQPASCSVQRKTSDAQSDAKTQGRVVLESASDCDESRSVGHTSASNLRAGNALEDAGERASRSDWRNSAVTNATATAAESNGNRSSGTQSTASVEGSGSMQSAGDAAKSILNETIVIEDKHLVTAVPKPVREPIISAALNHDVLNAASGKLAPRRKSDPKHGQLKSGTSRLQLPTSKKQKNLSSVSAVCRGTLSVPDQSSSSSSNMSSHPEETKARTSTTHCTRLAIPKPGTF